MIMMAFRNNLGYAVSTILMSGLPIPSIAKYLLILPGMATLIGAFIWIWDKYVKDANITPIVLSLNDSWTQHIISKEQKRDIIGTILLWITFISLGINARTLLEQHLQWFSFLQTVNPSTIANIFCMLFMIGLVPTSWAVLRKKNQRYQEQPHVKKTFYLLIAGILLSAYALVGFIFYNILHL